MPITKPIDGKYASVDAQSLADGLDELLILRAMKRRLEEWAVELDANHDKPGDVGKFIAAELRNRMAGVTISDCLSAEVLRGLQLMRRHLDEGGHDWRAGTAMTDVKSAREWLDERLDLEEERT